MDALEAAAVHRARSALDLAFGAATGKTTEQKAAAFMEGARVHLTGVRPEQIETLLKNHANAEVVKAAAETLDGTWGSGSAAELAQAYVASVAGGSLLDQVARFAAVIPTNVNVAMVASGFTADVVAEGAPKVVKNPNIAPMDAEPTKVAAIVVLTDELARATGTAGMTLFRRELTSAVLRATNTAVFNALADTSSTVIAGTGDVVADLRRALQAAPASTGYVVSASPGVVAALALSDANISGLGINGGELVPGVAIVPVEGATTITVIPASRLALRDWGLIVRTAGHASVDMRDTPDGPAQLTSLWQTNSLGAVGERMFLLTAAPDANLVIVEPAP